MLLRSLSALLLAAAFALAASTAPGAERLAGPMLKGETLRQAAATMLADIGQASWVRDGQSTHVIYVFFDPNCPFCHKVYVDLRPQVERGEVELRWIPIAVLMTTSLGKAASILEAKDPTAAFHKNERGFSRDTGTFGGIEEEPVPHDDTLKRLDRNLALLRRSGADSVPALLFRTRDGKTHFIVGAPPQPVLTQILRELQ
jgi:thiol:disulfide interchange protein DsbG